jgi:HemY protein
MFRALFFFGVLLILALGEVWLVERPGQIILTWQGYRIETSVLVALTAVAGLVALIMMVWSAIRFFLRLPPSVSVANRARRRDKGYAALSRGIIAVGTGDAKLALKAAAEAQRYLPHEPLALLLKAEAAQLNGDHFEVETAYRAMTRRDDTRLLGYRGLHAHAQRRGDSTAAHHFASTAHGIAVLPWTATAVLEKHVAARDWGTALAALDNSGTLFDRPTGDRQRAVLTTAIALDKEQTEPDEALRLANTAVKRAPGLVPAVTLAARLLARQGNVRRATKMIQTAWMHGPHPDLAKVYLDLYPRESHADHLTRARALAKLAPNDPESRMALASAAIAACDYKIARETMLPLIQGDVRPTVRMCLVMAELEEAEHGESGFARDWLARATRAPRDATWVAGATLSDHWLPAVPGTGKLDAFVWQRPNESLHANGVAEEAVFRPVSAPEAGPPILIEKPRAAISPPELENPSGEVPAADTAMPGETPAEPEDPLGPPIAPVAMAPLDHVPDEPSKPRGWRQFF